MRQIRSTSRGWIAAGAAALCASVGCGAAREPVSTPSRLVATPLAPAPPAPPEPLHADAAPALDAVLIQRVPEGTFGPYLGVSAQNRVAVWAALTPANGRRWFSVALDARGAPLGEVRSLANAPYDLSLATVAPNDEGFVALITAPSPTGTRIEALQLGMSGELISGPTPLVHSRTDVVWLDALRVGQKTVALWATLEGQAAAVHLAPVDSRGTALGTDITLVDGALAWQALDFGDGIALAVVSAGATASDRTLRVQFLDGDGRRLAQTEVAAGKGLTEQLDAVRAGDNLLLAWTELDGLEPALRLAALGPDSRLVVTPRFEPGAFGAQRLHALVPTGDRRGDAFLIWENVGQAPPGQHRFQIGRVSPRASLDATLAELNFSGTDSQTPEFVTKGLGLAALTVAPAHNETDPAASSEAPVPSFVELGPALDVLASEPLRLAPESGQFTDLAWGLNCSTDACAALGALPVAPVPIYGIELRARSTQWLPLATTITPGGLPRASDMRAIARVDPLADVDAAPIEGGWLVASLTQFDEATPYVKRKTPAPDGKLAPLRALLSVQSVGVDSKLPRSDKVISYRARAAGGLAIARAPRDQALLAWTALDQQRPEVFATLLDRTGQPVAQRMLTVDAGDVTSVRAAALGQGFLVAWIAERDIGPQVIAARLGPDLGRVAQQTLTRTPGVTTSFSLLAHSDSIGLGYVRDAESEQTLFVTRIDPKTLTRIGEEVAVARTQGGSLLSPTLVRTADGALLGWVERPAVVSAGGSRARLLELSSDLKPKGEVMSIGSVLGDPVALRLVCEAGQCFGALDSRPPQGHSLEGFVWEPGGPAPSARPLSRRATLGADTPAFAAVPGSLFYADRAEQSGLLRRLRVDWQRVAR
jgi:hypothetical protein